MKETIKLNGFEYICA